MADVEVQVIAKAVGFDALAAQATEAKIAFEKLAAAIKGTNGVGAKQLNESMSRVTRGLNGAAMGAQIGNQIRTGMSGAISNASFWSSAFSGLSGRFKAFGQTLGRSVALGMSSAIGNIRGMNGGRGPSDTDLIGGALIGGLVFKGVDELVKSASERQQARLNLLATGLVNSRQAGALEGLATDWSNKLGNISTTEGLNFLKDSLQIFGSGNELFSDGGRGSAFAPEGRKAMDDLASLMSYLKTFRGGEHAGDVSGVAGQIANMIRSGEIKGLGTNPGDLANWVTRLTKISLASGVDPTTFLAAQRAAGAAFLALNDSGIAAFSAFVQENKQRAGVQLATSLSRMIGGNGQTLQSNEMLRSLGIISESDIANHPENFKLNKEGKVQKVYDTSMYRDYQLAAQNPYQWYATDLYDGMRQKIAKDKGFDIGAVDQPLNQRSKEALVDIIQAAGGTYGNRNQSTMAVEAIIQAANIAKRVANQEKVDLDEQKRNDSILHQTQAFNDQLNNLKANLGESILPAVNSVLQATNAGLKWLSGMVAAHQTLAKDLMLGIGGPILAGGVLAGGMFLGRLGALPFKMIGSVIRFIATLMAGIGVGVFDLVGGGAAIAGLSAMSGKIAQWISSIGILKTVLGHVGKLMGLIGTLGMAYEVGSWAAHTQTGDAMLDTLGKELRAKWFGADASHGNAQVAKEAYWKSGNVARSAIGLGPSGAPPSYLQTLIGDKAKYMDFAKNGEWLKHIQPGASPQTYLGGLGGGGAASGRRGIGNSGLQSGNAGPVPVVITQMPKEQSRPNVITTSVSISVQTNASPAAIGGAVGSAVGSSVSNALSDQHH